MSFYIVPTMLYQQQQKAKNNKSKKNQSRRSSRSSASIATDSLSKVLSNSKSNSGLSISELDEPLQLESTQTPQVAANSRKETIDNYQPLEKRNEGSSHSLNDKFKAIEKRRSLGSHSSDKRSQISENTSPLNRNRHLISDTSSGIRPDVLEFKTFQSLEVLNSAKNISDHFFKMDFAAVRCSQFLNGVCEHQISDAINFSGVRVHSLNKFVSRQKSRLRNEKDLESSLTKMDMHHFEGLIAYQLLLCRNFMRKLILLESNSNSLPPEELVQSNVINYIRFLLLLPRISQSQHDKLDEIYVMHYKFKNFFADMAEKLNCMRKDGYLDEICSDTLSGDALLQCVGKISYEFNLLENYFVHILVKSSAGFLIDHRITKNLFTLYKLNAKLEKKESMKVLVYNNFFSRQYSWYMAVSLPFLRVFETSIFYDLPSKDTGAIAAAAELNYVKRSDLSEEDESLWHDHFSQLNLGTFEDFKNLSRKDLAAFQRDSEASFPLKQSLEDGFDEKIKPINFEYFTKPLSSIETGTFHVIQSRDLNYQLTVRNYKHILHEFHRMLKSGGVLELPLFRSGDDSSLSTPQGLKTSFPDPSTYMGLEIKSRLNIIPHFLEAILQELSLLFGPKNIKFSSSLLSKKLNMNAYLINFTAFSIYELLGEVDKLCERFDQIEGFDKLSNVQCHYFFYIQAEKS